MQNNKDHYRHDSIKWQHLHTIDPGVGPTDKWREHTIGEQRENTRGTGK